MTEVTSETLEGIINAIVEAVHPERVILFGSRARGEAQSASDIDLLVVESEPFTPLRSRRKEMGRVCRALATLCNKNGRPRRFEAFGSNTRSVQAFLDSEIAGHQEHIQALVALAAMSDGACPRSVTHNVI